MWNNSNYDDNVNENKAGEELDKDTISKEMAEAESATDNSVGNS